ncbi:MAG: hypothetical protein ACT4PY_13210 [Armatimonadota bacterium]
MLRILAAGLAVVCVTSPARAAPVTEVTVRDLAQNPSGHHNDVVKVSGTIAGYESHVTARGTPYAGFRLQAGGASVAVFAGRPKGLQNGQRVRVIGTFVKSKRVGRSTFRNAVEAIRIEVLAK